jgi:hypothetical protein
MSQYRLPAPAEQRLLNELQARLVAAEELPRFHSLLRRHHYLGSLKPVGERLYYGVTDGRGEWVGLLVFNSAAKHLKFREQWIGWTGEQARRRLSLVVNNSRYLLLPQQNAPNLGSKALRLVLKRLSDDWQARYGHPVLVVETFVDPDRFCGTVYTANGWEELGQTDGWGRQRRDYYVQPDKPTQLPAQKWLQYNRFGWGIESGTHQRLDVAHNDDRCRIRNSNGLWLMGMFRRLGNSLFMEWRSRQRKPEPQTTTDFQMVMAEEHRRRAVRTVLSKEPRFA